MKKDLYFIKVTLNEEEYNSIVELSEQLNRPLAGTIKELLTFSALCGKMGTGAFALAEKTVGKEVWNESMKKRGASEQVMILKVKLFLLQLNRFSKSWRTHEMFVDK